MPSTYGTTAQGYANGRRESDAVAASTPGALEELRAWRAAQLDHGDTSYYGADGVRYWRAFWLGVYRERRAG